MTITEEDNDVARGHVLLIAAAPAASRRQIHDPQAAAAAVTALPAAVLLASWQLPTDIVPLVDPTEPQTVLARIREAARTPGPLVLHLCGLLVGTTASTWCTWHWRTPPPTRSATPHCPGPGWPRSWNGARRA
jgi:hypothetical protein